MNHLPTICVLLCVHNGAPYIRSAIDSILRQTWRRFELLIVDDASTDETAAILAGYTDPRIRTVRNAENRGLTASLNLGIAQSQSDYIMRQDADDLSHPGRMERQVGYLTTHPHVAAVGSQVRLIDEAGRSQGRKAFPLTHRGIWWSHLFDNALAHSSVMLRRSALAEVGGYDETYRVSQDYELWSRLGERHMLVNLPDYLATLRVLPSSITRTQGQPELFRSIQSAHFGRLFPGNTISDPELDLLSEFRGSIDPARLGSFLELFTNFLHRYQAAWPETRNSSDFCRTLSLQFERIGYNLLTRARSAGLREIVRAVRIWPPRALSMPWPRIAALTLFGENARSLYEKSFIGKRA